MPWAIARALFGHEVTYAQNRLARAENGELIRRAESEGYEALLTTDKNIRYKQNLAGRRIALLVLSHPQWPDVRLNLAQIVAMVNEASPGTYHEIEIVHRQGSKQMLVCFGVESGVLFAHTIGTR